MPQQWRWPGRCITHLLTTERSYAVAVVVPIKREKKNADVNNADFTKS